MTLPIVSRKAKEILSYWMFRCTSGRTYRFTHIGKEAVVPITDRNDYLFWNKYAKGNWERKTLQIMARYLTSESVCLDIGAWIGPTVIHASFLCKQVFALEPDPIAFLKLKATVDKACSGNISLLNCALTAVDGAVALGTKRQFGDTRSSMLLGDATKEKVTVRGVSIETLTREQALPQIGFVKLDIEGGEFLILNSMKLFLAKNKPHFHLSLHPCEINKQMVQAKMREVAEIASMWDYSYYANRHNDFSRLREIGLSELTERKNLVRNFEIFLTDIDARSMGFEVRHKQ